MATIDVARASADPRLQRLAGRIAVGEGQREDMEVENPATGQTLATVPRCTADDLEQAVRRARAAQKRWKLRLIEPELPAEGEQPYMVDFYSIRFEVN